MKTTRTLLALAGITFAIHLASASQPSAGSYGVNPNNQGTLVMTDSEHGTYTPNSGTPQTLTWIAPPPPPGKYSMMPEDSDVFFETINQPMGRYTWEKWHDGNLVDSGTIQKLQPK